MIDLHDWWKVVDDLSAKSEVELCGISLICCGIKSSHKLNPNRNTGRVESGIGLNALRIADSAYVDIAYCGKEYEILPPSQ